MQNTLRKLAHLGAACLILAASVPMPAFAQEEAAPPSVDATLDKLMQLDPAAVAAKLKEYEAQAAAKEAEAAKLRGDADAKQAQSQAIAAQLEALKARVTTLSALFTEAKPMEESAPMNAAAPAMAEGEMMMAKAEPAAEAAAPKVTYAEHILPIFQERCASCHNDSKQKGGLQVDNFEYLMEGGSSGEVIVPGNADGSRLFKLVTGQETPVMPPDGNAPLSAEQIALLREWLNLGAPENSGSKVMVAEAATADVGQMYVAAEIVDGPPPMPEVALPLFVDNPPQIPARAIATNPRSPLMAVAGYRQVMLYNLEDNALIGALPFEEGEIETLSFSVNGELLVAGGGAPGKSGCAVVWQVRSGERLGKYNEGYDTVLAADISPDHKFIAVGGPNKTVSVFSTATGERAYKVTDHTDWIYSVKFTPDGEVLATADRAGGLFLWQAANGRAVEQLRGHNGAIHDLAYSADSVQLASAGADGTVRLWNTWEYNQIRSFNAHGGGVFSVDFSAANEMVTTGQDKTIKRWDINGTELMNYGALPDWGYQARFGLADGKVVAGGWTGEVGVWNTAAVERVATLGTALPQAQPTQVAAATPAQ